MANSTPESEFDLKKRLIGAFILIGFGVVVLPALLGGEDPQLDPDQAHPTPSLESKVFVSKITPIGGATPKLTPVQKSDSGATSKPVVQEPVLKEDETKVSKVEPAPPPDEVQQKKKSEGEPGWVVRVGTFAKVGNAERVMKRLQQAGFEPSTTKISTDNGSATRVWIGPYAQRVEAARMRKRVNQVTGGEAYIAAYP